MAKKKTVEFIESVSAINGGYDVGTICQLDAKIANQWIKAGYCKASAAKGKAVQPSPEGQMVQEEIPEPKDQEEESSE